MSKIILALHDLYGHDSFKMMVKLSGSEPVFPERVSLDSVLQAIPNYDETQSKVKVLMDVNYSMPNTDSLEPFLKIEKEMTLRGYDTKQALMGFSGRDTLIESARQQYPDFRFFIKGTDPGKTLLDFFK